MIKLKDLLMENEEDQKYLELVRNNDLKNINHMVERTANKKGYGIGPVAHVTNSNIYNKIDMSKSNEHGYLGPALYATISGNNWNPSHIRSGRTMYGYVGGKILDLSKPITDNDIKVFSDFLGRTVEGVPLISLERRFGRVSTGLLHLGYSAAIHMGPGNHKLHIAVFDPHMFKLSDSITYDDDKQIIPLSKRFNPLSDDIRY